MSYGNLCCAGETLLECHSTSVLICRALGFDARYISAAHIQWMYNAQTYNLQCSLRDLLAPIFAAFSRCVFLDLPLASGAVTFWFPITSRGLHHFCVFGLPSLTLRSLLTLRFPTLPLGCPLLGSQRFPWVPAPSFCELP